MDINEAWKSTYRLLLGAECTVALDQCADWLKRHHYPPTSAKSAISGKSVSLARDCYCKGARIISQDEIDFKKSAAPLNINDIKDIDSVLEAVQERVFYAGNKIFGKCEHITASDSVFDSFHVYESQNISSSKYIAHSSYIRDGSEFVFGGSWLGYSKFLIHTVGTINSTRVFECYASTDISDAYCSYSCIGCSNCMFSMSQKSRQNIIGNQQLPKDKYRELSKKLIAEIQEWVEKHKSFPAIFEFPGLEKPPLWASAGVPKQQTRNQNMEIIDKAFITTSKIVLGEEIGRVRECNKLLEDEKNIVRKVISHYGNTTYNMDIFFFGKLPEKRMLANFEADALALKLNAGLEDGESLRTLMGKLGRFAYFAVNFEIGNNLNNIETVVAYNGVNTYRIFDGTNGKYLVNCAMALDSDYVFGGFRTVHCKFCVKCNNSVNLSNCFEMDSCTSCRDSMFCHNCENLDNCMFCFNTKSKRYAICNVEVGREKYMQIKAIVTKEMTRRIRENGTAGFDIYSLGCLGKR
ncbi:hypothetical protein FJZ26_02675 [Candidatus Parvarchaeota archaeon]|nr:hypothetical protein [Candidatus Parvarchaeota archaeon]